MPDYKYTAIDRNGAQATGRIDGMVSLAMAVGVMALEAPAAPADIGGMIG